MYLSTIHSFVSIYKSITFMHISRFILVPKSTSFTFFCSRFVYVHTFFHYKIMCGFRLRTCLYDIRQTSYERRLHHGYVAPPVPIWAEFAPILGKYIPIANSSRYACPVCLHSTAAIVYRHILLGENSFDIIRTRAHEKNPARFFSRRAIICTVYCWEKCKKL